MHRQLLPDGVGGGNAFAFAIAGPAHAANDRVNFVTGSFRIFQPFEQEGPGPFAHHKTIGSITKRPCSSSTQRANFAKLDEAADTHVAVYPARHHCVHLVFGEQFNSRVYGGKTGGASSVGDEVGAAQVQHIGHPPGDDVGQFAGHGIFGDAGQGVVNDIVPMGENGFACGRGQLLELWYSLQGTGIFGENNARIGDVMEFPPHRRA